MAAIFLFLGKSTCINRQVPYWLWDKEPLAPLRIQIQVLYSPGHPGLQKLQSRKISTPSF